MFLLRISLNSFDQTKNTPVTCYDPGNTKHQQKPGFCIQPLIQPTADQKTYNNRQSQFQTHRTVQDPFWARFVWLFHFTGNIFYGKYFLYRISKKHCISVVDTALNCKILQPSLLHLIGEIDILTGHKHWQNQLSNLN